MKVDGRHWFPNLELEFTRHAIAVQNRMKVRVHSDRLCMGFLYEERRIVRTHPNVVRKQQIGINKLFQELPGAQCDIGY